MRRGIHDATQRMAKILGAEFVPHERATPMSETVIEAQLREFIRECGLPDCGICPTLTEAADTIKSMREALEEIERGPITKITRGNIEFSKRTPIMIARECLAALSGKQQ